VQKVLINIAVVALAVLIALFAYNRLHRSHTNDGNAAGSGSNSVETAPANVAANGEPTNLLDNGGFDSGVVGWTAGPSSTVNFISDDDSSHESASGSLEVSASPNKGNTTAIALSKCFPIVGSAKFAFGAHTKVVKGNRSTSATFNCSAFSDAACSHVVAATLTAIPAYLGTEWREMGPLSGSLPAGARWIKCGLSVTSGNAENGISARMDDAYFKSLRPN